jgi:hypothetical protein
LPGLPPVSIPVEARDTYVCSDLDLARQLAVVACNQLRIPKVPDLRELAQRLSA